MYTPKLSYVITYRHSQDKIMNLRRIVDWLMGFSDIEIILVEQDRWSKIAHLNLRVNHIFVKSDLPFNRAWGYNVALKRCNSPIVIFSDCDTLMDPNGLIDSLNKINDYDVIKPYSSVINLDPYETSTDFRNILTINRDGVKVDDKTFCDGLTIFKKESIIRLGGWNEDFVGSVGESEFQMFKINKFLKTKMLEHKCYKLTSNIDKHDEGLYNRNQQILNHYRNADSNTFQTHINGTMPKLGTTNKYNI